MTTSYHLDDRPIACHSWSPDGTRLAISQTSREICIFRLSSDAKQAPVLEHTLSKHTGKVLSLDWSRSGDRLVSGGADRNAFVWTLAEEGEWKPLLVVIRLKRAATSVRWSPQQNKFAVGSGDKLVAVCYYDTEQDFWISKHIKRNVQSTITSVDWHPNNVLIAAGCADFRVRVFSGWVKEIEDRPSATPWGKKMPFGEEMASFLCGGWVHHVAFSPSGNRLLWVGHDCSISVVDAAVDAAAVVRRLTPSLPALRCVWLTEASFAIAGHDAAPYVAEFDSAAIGDPVKIDTEDAGAKAGGGAGAFFRNMETLGQGDKVATKLKTIHQNAITGMCTLSSGESVDKVSTTGKDGQVVLWNLKSLEASVAGLKIQ